MVTAKKPTAKKTTATTPKLKVAAKSKTPKEIATKKKEPYVAVIGVELEPENPGNGAFELDWNEYFVAKLVKAGYTGKDDAQIVDRWFQDICRNVVMENFEQWEANQPRDDRLTLNRRDLGNGRTEVS
jgi:hypothetical protein